MNLSPDLCYTTHATSLLCRLFHDPLRRLLTLWMPPYDLRGARRGHLDENCCCRSGMEVEQSAISVAISANIEVAGREKRHITCSFNTVVHIHNQFKDNDDSTVLQISGIYVNTSIMILQSCKYPAQLCSENMLICQ